MSEPQPPDRKTGRIVTVVLSYAAFASLWILLSDRAVAVLFSDPTRITMVSTLKGWAFVVVTSLLLYVQMRRLSGSADAPGIPSGSLKQLLVPVGLLCTAILALTAGGIGERFDRQKQIEIARLQVIADLKARQIVAWLGERQDDARFLQTSQLFADCYRRWRVAGDIASRELLQTQLAEFGKSHGLAGTLLLDERGETLWDSRGPAPGNNPELRAAALKAAADRQVSRLGPYRDQAGRLRLEFIAPLTSGGDSPPTVVMSVDPAEFFFPNLQSWPVPSRSGEIVLFRREGEQVVFLNQLRHRPDMVLKLSVPVANAELPASRILRGEFGSGSPVEGKDYRGVPIVGFVRDVPGTDWFLAAKVDKAELHADAAAGALWIGLAGLLALCGAGAGAFLLLQRRQLAATLRERQAQEEKLRALQLLEAIAESSDDAIFAKDLEGRYLLFNREASRVTGKPPEQVLGRDDHAVFPPAEAELLMAIGRQVVAENRTVTNEETLTTTAGTSIFLATKGPLHDAAGRVVGHFGISRDITARKAAEEALRENEALTRAVLDNLPIGIAVNSVDPAVAFYMNDNFPLFYRTTREQLADPDAFWNAVYEEPEFREEIKKRVLDDCASGDPQRMQWVDVPITRNGEETHFVTARNTPVPGKRLMISTVWDVTVRKRAEEEKARLEAQLLQAQKMESVGRLAGGVAHDFNNMLFVIMGHAAMALERVDPAQPLHANLEEIRKAAQRSADLTRQLLAFARRQTVAPQVLDLNQVVTGMLSMLRRLIGEDIDLAWRPRAGLWPVKVDPAQIDQILANLCVNARDAIVGVGRITIETDNVSFDAGSSADHPGSVPGEFVLIAVSDDGCGMSKEVQAHLFEPFFTTKGVGQGTGLGLATVYGIVKQNDGFINVSSEPERGTTVRIYLRRCAGAAVAAATEPLAEMPLGHGETVLLVEDEASILNLGMAMLERLGYTVQPAGTPDEALRLAGAHPGAVNLLITDVVMPGMNGRDLARLLGAGNPGLACLFMSGYTADVIAHHGVLDENVRFIQKPFSLGDLAAKVREALEGHRAGPATAAAQPAAPGCAAPPRVMCVDDEAPLLELVRRFLERHGCVAAGYADPAAALAEFRRAPEAYDFVVTDLAMPGLTGFELARELLAARADMPIVMMSGYVTPQDEAAAQALGALALIQKPGTVEELGDRLLRLFRTGGPTPQVP
jgi:PAS domain S-box-containing protein